MKKTSITLMSFLLGVAVCWPAGASGRIPEVGQDQYALAPQKSKNVPRESYQIALMLELWNAWHISDSKEWAP